jgi:hypothetical protein
MSTSMIDGTVAEAVTRRSRGGITIFKSIRFDLDDGSSRTVTKAVVKQEVADELVPGAKGRFYQFKAFDISGIHGLRAPDGRAVYGFPGNNQKLFLVLGIVNLLWIAVMIAARGAVPMLGVALLILAALGWYFMGQGQAEAKRQFDGDAGYPGPAAASQAEPDRSRPAEPA